MGGHDFSAQLVHRSTTRLLQHARIAKPPPWFDAVADFPPSGQSIVRPVLRHDPQSRTPASRRRGNRPSRNLFRPPTIAYEEDALRREFFSDHPWELARPRVVVEGGGNDARGWDWSRGIRPGYGGRGVDGESVIQRQLHLMRAENLPKERAYDVARREFYAARHLEEVRTRVAREEALASGAYFGASAQDVGVQLEDEVHARFKEEALRRGQEIAARASASGYDIAGPAGGEVAETDDVEAAVNVDEESLEDMAGSVTTSGGGAGAARGGVRGVESARPQPADALGPLY